MNKKIVIFLLLTILGGGFFYFTKLTKVQKIRIGMNQWPGYEAVALAKHLGLYEKNGLDVEIVSYASLNDVKIAYMRGHIDIMASTVVEAVQLKNSHDKDVKIILLADYSNGADEIIGLNIKKMSDLKGKSIGIESATLGEYVLNRGLSLSGLNREQVKTISMDQAEMEAALENGVVEAVVTYPPTSISIKNLEKAKPIFTTADIPYEVVDILGASPKILESVPNLREKIWIVWKEALEYITTNEKEAFAYMAEREQISIEEFAEAFADVVLITHKNQKELLVDNQDKIKLVINEVLNIFAPNTQIKPEIFLP